MPDGYCGCGCGQQTSVSRKSRRGYAKGESLRFIRGHYLRTRQGKEALYTPERNAKISMANLAREYAPQPRGTESPHHRGDAVGYSGIHQRLVAERGTPCANTCVCGAPAAEWALDRSLVNVIRSDVVGRHEGKPFSTDLNAYVPMCRSCHRRADRRKEG